MKKIITLLLCFILAFAFVGCENKNVEIKDMKTVAESVDAYVRYDSASSSFELGTSKSKLIVSAGNGGIGTISFVNAVTGNEHIGSGEKSGFSFKDGNEEKSSASLDLKFKNFNVETLEHGEIKLVIVLEGKNYNVEYTYTVFPGTSLIKSSYKLTNVSKKTVNLKDFSFIDFSGNSGSTGSEKFVYMTGGGNFTGSLLLRENALTEGYEKTMISYDEREVGTNSKGYYDTTQDPWNGYSGYEPFFAIQNSMSGDGVYFVFEYAGLWEANVVKGENTKLKANVTLLDVSLAKGESFTSPESYIGLFSKSLDNMTNDLLSYQYDYMWDYTGEIYPMATTDTWSTGVPPTFDNVVSLADQARYLGLDLVHIDDNLSGAGWYDKKMDWNNKIDVKSISDYLHASNIKSSVWATVQHYDYASSAIAKNAGLEIPDLDSGYYGPVLCVGNDETLTFMRNTLNSIVSRNSLDMVKTDGWVIAPCEDETHTHGGSENGYGAAYCQYYGFLDYLKSSISSNDGFSWIMCASGGELHGMEYLEYATYVTTTDGAAENPIAALSYIFPSGKFQSGYAQVANYSPGNTRVYGFGGGITTVCNLNDTSEEYAAKLESMRKDIALYRYLRDNGVLGRYSWQYHLTTSVLGQSLYMKTDRYADKAVVMGIPAGYDKKIYPIGLDPEKEYTVSFYNNKNFFTATGEELIKKGVSVAGCELGEMIFFNMPNTPSSGRDISSPYLGNECYKTTAEYIGVSGVALTWTEATDDNFISYYAIYKNGELVDKVSSGLFWFDKNGSINDTYEIRAVDGDENVSEKVTAMGGNA